MPLRQFNYRWEFDLESSPDQIWPLVSDTNRFNRDTGVPSVEMLADQGNLRNARRRLHLSVLGIPVEWEEQPFEWVRPHRFGVVRRYSKGPMKELQVRVELTSQPITKASGENVTGTKLTYEVRATPANVIGLLAIPVQIGIVSARNFARTIREYDKLARHGRTATSGTRNVDFASGGRDRLLALSEKLVALGNDQELTALLVDHVENADEFAAARMRPYELARMWQQPRRRALETFLCATRAGILDLQWNLMCPLCRGGSAMTSLTEVDPAVHCPGCNIDFNVNFEQSVELTFRPNVSIRKVEAEMFCVGGPQVMPHVVAQQLLAPGDARSVDIDLETGRYRVRTMSIPGWQQLIVNDDRAAPARTIRAAPEGWPNEELPIDRHATLELANATDEEQLFILERTAWNDDAATASEVTALQVFRDLFATEALRPGEQISVGTLTVLFTDLKNSTRMYREIGDATAFGHVMNHFDVLKQVIAEHDGALVKTIGDAVMAVFRQPSAALKAMLHAQQRLADANSRQPLTLKAGVHVGPCIAVTLNDRLDYFGSTVNLAARLEGQSTGEDIVISSEVYDDPEVRSFLGETGNGLVARRFEIPLKGFDEEKFALWRVGLLTRTNDHVD
jgi:class 3 adenylate cyclase